MEVFNNREIAIAIWLGIAVVFLFCKRSTRQAIVSSLPGLLKSMFGWKLVLIYSVIIAYTCLMVYMLQKINLWDESQLKNTIIWTLTVGLISLSDITNEKTSNYLKSTALDIFRVTTVIEFLIMFYAFSLAAELIIVPVTGLIIILLAVAKRESKFADVVVVLKNMLVLGGVGLIVYAVYRVFRNFHEFVTEGTLTEFIIFPVFSFLFLPCVYVLSLLVNIEVAFISISRSLPNKGLVWYAKWKVILNFPLSKADLLRWQKIVLAAQPTSRKEIDHTIAVLRKAKKTERNPPQVNPEEGWPPYSAIKFLEGAKLSTSLYNPAYQQVWKAESKSLEIENTVFSSTVQYSVRGTSAVAKDLKIGLNVYYPAKITKPHARFLELTEQLMMLALGIEMPGKLKKAISTGQGITIMLNDKEVSLVRNQWLNHRHKGYELEFRIKIQGWYS